VVCSLGACKPKGRDVLPVTLPVVTLPPDDLAAARAVGVAAATEKDPVKLAATLVAFLDRLHVPVVSERWDKLLATGPKPGPASPWLWEPVVVGVARGTTSGHSMPFQQVMAGYLRAEDPKKIAKLDFADFVRQLAKAAAHQPLPVDGPLATAIVADLDQRKDLHARPSLDPTASMLLGLLLIAEQNAIKSMPAHPAPTPPAKSGPPHIPGMPSSLPFAIPNLPNVPRTPPRTVHAFDNPGSGGGSPGGCSMMSAGVQFAGSAFSGSTWVGKQVTSYGGYGVPPALDQFMADIADVLDGISIAGEITDGIAGMGIAAFVVSDGHVSPTSVAYGDGPATFTVEATSDTPFSKDQLNQFVDCLEALSGTSLGIDGLRNLPPAGPVSGLPVAWEGASAIDPKHGTFTPTAGGGASGIVGTLVQMGMSAIGGGTTDASGKAQATFQVKPKKGDQPANYTRRYQVIAQVYPFPAGTSKVFAGANLLFPQSVPIPLEIKVPFDSYQLTLTWSDRVQPPVNMYFQDDGQATVKVTVDGGTLSFHGTGHGTHAYTMPPQDPAGSMVTCSAPVGGQPVDVTVDGKITDVDSMSAEVHIKVTPASNREAMTIQCTAAGHTATRHANAIYGSVSSGTELENFNMTLGDGETKSVSMDKSAGPMEVTGTGNIALAVDDSSGP
jgi:hypothetical protein